MTIVNKIDSNVTGLAYQEEVSLGVADVAAPWNELEPNSYSDFGPQVTNVARAPIVSDRQRKKGVLTDLDASGGFSGDLTQDALPDIGQGVMFADLEPKDEATSDVVTLTNTYTVPSALGSNYAAGDLIFVQGFTDATNNGLKTVNTSTATTIVVDETLVNTTGESATIRRVGFEFASGDIDVVAPGTAYPTLTAAVKDLTELGLIPGEFIFVGGDDSTAITGDQMQNAVNNGYMRVRSIVAGVLTIDKSSTTLAAETGGEAVKIFFASRILRNRGAPSNIVRRSYMLERQLGYPDDTFQGLGYDPQAEYLKGAVASTLQINIATADKMTFDIAFMGTDIEQVASFTSSLKAGPRPAMLETEAYNSSSDVARINMAEHSATDENPTALFSYIQDMNFTVDNTLTANKGVGKLGPFDLTAGIFAVSGSMNAFYADVATTSLIQRNADVSIDFHMSKSNQGISIDFPLVTLGDGRPDVQADAPIMVPITYEAASGAKIDPNLDHTVMFSFWDYLPSAASA